MITRTWLPSAAIAAALVSTVSFVGCGSSDVSTPSQGVPTDSGGTSSTGGTSGGAGKGGAGASGKGGAGGTGGSGVGAGGASGKGGAAGPGGTSAAGGHGGGGTTGVGGTSAGGAPAGQGGAPAGPGGAPVGQGGAPAGPGGAPAGAGGEAAGAGGDTTGAGGDAGGAGGDAMGGGGSAGQANAIQTVFVIMMENHSATSIYGSKSAPYINNTLFPIAARATAYKTTIHPSEPNYVWLEAGSNLGITNDNDPVPGNELTADHLSAQLVAKGIPWKAYVEGADGKTCPLTSKAPYGVKHVPQLFFSDTSEGFKKSSTVCTDHVRPFADLATDLAGGTEARYNFIVPNLCNDMHGDLSCGIGGLDTIKTGDTWLSTNLPVIAGSSAFTNGGLILIVWDEGDEPLGQTASDGPLPMLALGSMVKPAYTSSIPYTHSSTLKTMETIFGLPLLGGAGDASTSDLSDMFTQFP